MAITGASGAPYATRLLQLLLGAGVEVHLVISAPGRRLLAEEAGVAEASPAALAPGCDASRLIIHPCQDIGAAIASGSFLTDGMVICPCSSNTLAAVAGGLGDNLITRAAQVTLKERRRLVLVPRETPLSPIEIENMHRLSQAGAILCPACPGFYLKPTRVSDLVDFVVGKVLDLLGVAHGLGTRYQP
ncbi:MAG: Flavin prenyltransferase UbiX [Phycisphaerae bacterium]|nr:Flavin prenyltransferase UbiX [Phycisphaerae bacterium]